MLEVLLARLGDLLHLLVVERPDVALPHLHDVVTDLAVETLYCDNDTKYSGLR